ncbi:DUF1281 family ferredoxin-like fold protein [Paenibacillus planticolens]|uniref:YubB ferredoxin-like domain-containing protein n=1 Tax=Paenibacillus planticolens TaxID=2654976 RepID=A0ABX1ZIN3_9BACL|nr:hypothetical protein [Paenibacillus planticolens]NOU99502.1 hypothetical protein [Paenibacillus planticolens]
MPNHISNKLRIIGTGEQVTEVMEFIKYDNVGIGTIDFNKITPMPRWVFGSSSDIKGICISDKEKWGKDNIALGWARLHWGTKWNAYSQPDNRNTKDTLYFKTAWNGVPDIIQKLAWIFPNVTLEYSFADEAFGSSNCGIYRFKENEILEDTYYQSNSKEAYELAFDLANDGKIPSWYKFNEEKNTYERVNND